MFVVQLEPVNSFMRVKAKFYTKSAFCALLPAASCYLRGRNDKTGYDNRNMITLGYVSRKANFMAPKLSVNGGAFTF